MSAASDMAAREPLHRRTHARVRRKSRRADRGYVRPLSWPQAHRQRRIFAAWRVTTARKGQREGSTHDGHTSFSAFDEKVYGAFCEWAASFKGKVEPSLRWIAHKVTGSPTRTKRVCAALRRLADAGWLEWERRYEELDGRRGVRGPQVEQTTNLYRVLDPPARAVALVAAGEARRRAPPPDDAAWAAAKRDSELAAHQELRRRKQLDRRAGRPEPRPAGDRGHGYATQAEMAQALRDLAAREATLADDRPPGVNVIPLRGENPGSES